MFLTPTVKCDVHYTNLVLNRGYTLMFLKRVEEAARVKALGGEGVMLRKASALHRGGRTTDLLKVKEFQVIMFLPLLFYCTLLGMFPRTSVA